MLVAEKSTNDFKRKRSVGTRTRWEARKHGIRVGLGQGAAYSWPCSTFSWQVMQ
jgi:hypothetical protein